MLKGIYKKICYRCKTVLLEYIHTCQYCDWILGNSSKPHMKCAVLCMLYLLEFSVIKYILQLFMQTVLLGYIYNPTEGECFIKVYRSLLIKLAHCT